LSPINPETAWKQAHHFRHSRTVGQTVAVRIERKRFGAVFSSARVRRTINVQMESGLWGIWAFRPDAKSVSYVLSM